MKQMSSEARKSETREPSILVSGVTTSNLDEASGLGRSQSLVLDVITRAGSRP